MSLDEKLEELKKKIDEFISIKIGKRETVGDKYSFVKRETAEVIQRAVKEIILENGRDKSEFNSYLDLCFGSGNLSIHILEALDFFELDENNDLKIKDGKIVIFNDKNDFAYWKLENLVKGIQFTRQDVFEVVKSEGNNKNKDKKGNKGKKSNKEKIEKFVFIENIQSLLKENKDKKFDFITANFLIKSSDDNDIGAIALRDERIEVLKQIFNNLLSENGIFLFVKNSRTEDDLKDLAKIFGGDAYYITIFFDRRVLGQDLNFISKRPIIKEQEEAKNE